MKKLITVAAVASVALASDFLGQHKPVAIVKDGLNIVKDLKSHSYGKLIKDGVKITKDLKFEDQELFTVSLPPELMLKYARETVVNQEAIIKQFEADLPKAHQMGPEKYEEFLEEYKYAQELLKFKRNLVKDLEIRLITEGTNSRKLQGDDNEFFAQNELERKKLRSVEDTSKQLEDPLPTKKKSTSETNEKLMGIYKQWVAQKKKELEAVEAAGNTVKFQPMRRLFADDNEFFNLNEVEAQLRESRAELALVEKTFQEVEKELPAIKNAYPAVYAQMSEEVNKQKQRLAQAKKEMDELEALVKAKAKASTGTAIKFKPMRKLFAEDNEFVAVNETEDQLRQMKEMLVQTEALIRENEVVHLPQIKILAPHMYEQYLERLNYEKKQLADAKLLVAELEIQVKNKSKANQGATKFRKPRADDDELFNLSELLKEGKKIRDEIKHH